MNLNKQYIPYGDKVRNRTTISQGPRIVCPRLTSNSPYGFEKFNIGSNLRINPELLSVGDENLGTESSKLADGTLKVTEKLKFAQTNLLSGEFFAN